MRGLLVLAGALALTGCGAGAPTYAACTDDLDCSEPSDACYRLRFTRTDGTEADGRLCSLGCASDADCPEGGACVALDGDPEARFFCAARCETSTDCYAGFACTRVEGADRTMQLCFPRASGG
ncbi:MAG TPA: hypothetical protein RMH99_15150 [Sandaracinaceae bacterium LLY-WYZ-13_1]|nr:hypothetical protein [Sandaracinaceae bacterium LLY-WYZ-13_1]